MKLKIWIKAMDICRKYWGCHQLPERSLFIKGYQFPVCTRCMGIWIGIILSVAFLIFKITIPIRLSLLFMFVMIIDGGIQYVFKIMSNNVKRIVTGTLYGFGIIQLIYSLIQYFLK